VLGAAASRAVGCSLQSVAKLPAQGVELTLADLSDEAPVVCSCVDIENGQGFQGFRLEDNVSDARRGVSQLEDDVFELEDYVFELEDDVFELEDDVFDLEDDVFELEDDVFELALQSVFGTLKPAERHVEA
jgi:hypothetical protein